MTEAHTTSSTFQAQYPLALAALATHMLEHGLPAPYAIDQAHGEIVVRLTGGVNAVEAWIVSVAVDRETNEDTDLGGVEGLRSAWLVRLPDTGFRFTFVAYRPYPTMRFAS